MTSVSAPKTRHPHHRQPRPESAHQIAPLGILSRATWRSTGGRGSVCGPWWEMGRTALTRSARLLVALRGARSGPEAVRLVRRRSDQPIRSASATPIRRQAVRAWRSRRMVESMLRGRPRPQRLSAIRPGSRTSATRATTGSNGASTGSSTSRSTSRTPRPRSGCSPAPSRRRSSALGRFLEGQALVRIAAQVTRLAGRSRAAGAAARVAALPAAMPRPARPTARGDVRAARR